MRIDLHTHSTISDGSDTLNELLDYAAQKGIDALALTDHDTLSGYQKFVEIIKIKQIRPQLIFGIEVSACDTRTNKVVHILGYNLNPAPDPLHLTPLEELCSQTLKQRFTNACDQVEALQRLGYQITRDEVAAYAHDSATIYKQHIMRALTDKTAQHPAYKQLYRELFGKDGLVKRSVQYPDFRDVLVALREQGAFSVLAHPGQSKAFGFVDEMVQLGLGGIERNHPDHSTEHEQICDELCERYGLIATGGSDYHGIYGKHNALGESVVDGRYVSQVCAILGLDERH